MKREQIVKAVDEAFTAQVSRMYGFLVESLVAGTADRIALDRFGAGMRHALAAHATAMVVVDRILEAKT